MHFRRFLPFLSLTCAAALITSGASFASTVTSQSSIAKLFSQVSTSVSLASPALILMDKKTGEIIYEKDAASSRKPASILKILSTSVALQYLEPSSKFVTRAYLSILPRTVLLEGSFDPWMTASSFEAGKYRRAWSPYLQSKAMAALNQVNGGTVKSVNIKYSRMYAGDISSLTKYFRVKGVVTKFEEISSSELANEKGEFVASVSSPSIADMVKFALTWSDNLLAERLARAGAHAAGFPMSDIGVRDSILEMLDSLGVDPAGLDIYDGSGLSKEDRVTASLMAQVLFKLRLNPRYDAIYEGMPIAGLTGTLEGRFFSTAPEAIGLVHAKTGTLDGTVSLAGYVDAGDREYIFVAIADRIRKGTVATDQARNTIDHLLGKIASPLTVAR